MSMREEVLKLAKEVGFLTKTYNSIDGPEVVDSDYDIITDELEHIYQAAYLAGAKAMQEEAAKALQRKITTDHNGYPDQAGYRVKACIAEISDINPENLK